MMSSGMSAFSRWMCSAIGVSFSSAKRRKVSWTISKSPERCRGPSVSTSEARNSGDRYVGDEAAHAVERIVAHAPLGLPAEHLGGQVGQHVGGERRGDLRLVRAPVAVVEQAPGGHDPGGGVGHVVGQDLVLVDAVGGEPGDGGVEHALGEVERRTRHR